MHKTSGLALLVASIAACGGQSTESDTPKQAAHGGPRSAHAEAAPVPAQLPPPIVATKDGELVDASGQPIHLHGVNFFGLNTQGYLGGTWSTDPMAGDFATVVWRQKALGFNAVRVPFSFSLFKNPAQTPTFSCQPPDAAALAAATADPQDPGCTLPPPPLMRDPDRSSGRCNGYLPTSNVRDLFLYTVKFYVDNGFYVLADNHLREDRTAIDDFQAWVEGWKDVTRELEAYPPAHGRVLIDLLNEPGEKGLDWNHLGPMYLTAMDAIWSESQHFPFLIEGTGQESIGANWGDGFCTDQSKLTSTGSPLPFFNTLASKPYADWMVLGPHVYGPSVTNADGRFQGKDLFDRLDLSFGAHNSKGLAVTSRTLRPPVAIGEFGSKFEDDRDKAWLHDFSLYLRRSDAAAAPGMQPIGNWFYWDWNANSGDTGGLVTDDWKTLQWEKLRYLRGLGLTPWYASPAATAAPVAPAPTPPPAPAPPPSPPTATPPATSAPAAPSPAPATPPSVTPPADDGHCHVKVSLDATWKADGQTHATFNLFFTLTDQTPTKVPFALAVKSPAWRQLTQAWNVEEAKLADGALQGTVRADWASLLPGGHNVVNIGFIVAGDGDDLRPQDVTVDGRSCSLEQVNAK